ncbi:hypothetical protein SLEP1_g29338 [Rubroshorea leprosula]|uniref:Uncharacterized protein n=1 Tax=Rubroshorea leprosula TaxID=152421 RepID=A0AAV5JWM4_9ROSI|nr:hypothetical protein SLEP1_g29338 [Rubroshorea leprosula]
MSFLNDELPSMHFGVLFLHGLPFVFCVYATLDTWNFCLLHVGAA